VNAPVDTSSSGVELEERSSLEIDGRGPLGEEGLVVDLSFAILGDGQESERNGPGHFKGEGRELVSSRKKFRERKAKNSPDGLVLLRLHVSSRKESILPDLDLSSSDLLDGENRETDPERPGIHDLGDVLARSLADSVPKISRISIPEGLLLEVDRNTLDEDILSDLREREKEVSWKRMERTGMKRTKGRRRTMVESIRRTDAPLE